MIRILGLFSAFFLVVLLGSCGQITLRHPLPEDVQALSAGNISRYDSIRIEFTRPLGVAGGAELAESPVSLDPPVPGSARWENEHVLLFTPDNPLKTGASYKVSVEKLGSSPFDFMVRVPQPVLELSLGSLGLHRDKQGSSASIEGFVRSNERQRPEDVVKAVKVNMAGPNAQIEWEHDDLGRNHRFRLKGLERRPAPYSLAVSWSNASLGGSGGGSLETRIPGLSEFGLLSAQVRTEPQYCVELVFTDLLDPTQDLRGLVRLDGSALTRYELEDNRMRVFPDKPLAQDVSLQVEPELRSETMRTLGVQLVQTVAAVTQLPELRFIGTGVIVPDTQGLIVPIETMNLKEITVQAFRIYGDNMGQFLQVNELEGSQELYRVGKEVWREQISLPWTPSMANTWVRTGLDLGKLHKANPEGMLRIQISFGPGNTTYPGASALPEARTTQYQQVIGTSKGSENSYWDYWDSNEDEYYENYRNRMNPAHRAYYMPFGDHNVAKARNFLFSNLGILAKKSDDKIWHLAVTDLRDAKPVKGAQVILKDFVNQDIATGETDSNGLLKLKAGEEPFLVLAKTAGPQAQTGWLKLSPAQLLPVSSFDVSGVKPDAGVRGFLYGERGVWRPGDEIFLTFILFDPLKSLPAGHPVTLEFLDPQNRVVETRNLSASLNSNFYPSTLRTGPEDPTGDWTARVMVGNSVFTKTLKVETVKPNRLKIDLKFSPESPYLSGKNLGGTMAGAWLHGAPAPGLKADLGVRFSSVPTMFGAYTDYTFDDPSRVVVPESQSLFSVKLDDTGKSPFSATINVNTRPSGMLQADFLGRIYEDEGTWSAEQFSMPYHYYQNYVGLKLPKGDEARGMLLTDVNHPAQIVMLDRDGKPVSGKVDVEIFKLDWRWWWEKGQDNLAQFTEAPASRRVMAGTVDVVNGKAQWPFQVKYPDWGRYMVRVQDKEGKHSAARVVYLDWPGWAGRAQADGQGSSQVMTLNTDKTSYLTGEKVLVTFPSNKEGRALVSIEAKGRILEQQWIDTQDGTTRWQFTATPDMSPNCYVHISFLQPHLQTRNDLPMRLYGIVPVMVKDPGTEIQPSLKVADKILPNATTKVSVSEAKGRSMTYTLAMVDEGLLGLTRYKVPNPWSSFYSREASRLQSWDLYHLVAGAFGAKLATLLAVGGSDDGMGNAGQKPERFKPIVQFMGPFTLKAGETMDHQIEIPNYLGAVRFMVVGGTATAFGATEKSVVVKAPLAAQTTLPRVLGAGEIIDVPVRVFVEDPQGLGPINLSLAVTGGLSIDGPSSLELDLGGSLEGTALFRLKVGDTLGAAKVVLNVKAGALVSTETTDLVIRPVGVQVTRVFERMIKPGEKSNVLVNLPGVPSSNSLKFELSSLPPIDLSKSLQYLITYPYGCVEQTTSSVFPQLYLDQVSTLTAAESAAVSKNVIAGIERLRQFQIPSGAFSYWPGEQYADLWATNYAGHFLLEAKKRGFALPPGMLEKWYDFQKANANTFNNRDNQAILNQAYRLYTLALHGKPDLAAMNRLKENKTLPNMARWRLAASYLLAGQATAAAAFFQVNMMEFKPYKELDGTYGSDIRDRAIALETLLLLRQWVIAEPLYQELAKALSSGTVNSTQTTAYALIALMPMAKERSSSDSTYSWQWNNSTLRSEKTRKAYNTHVIDPANLTQGTLAVQNSGTGPLYLRVLSTGTPLRDNTPAVSNGLKLELEYLDAEGRSMDPALAKAGEEMLVRAKITNTSGKALANCALNHLLPGAWEVVNTRLAGEMAQPGVPGLDYQDIRDDRVMSFFSLKIAETRVIDLRVTRSFGGRFWMPAVKAEVMYDPAIAAIVPGRWLE